MGWERGGKQETAVALCRESLVCLLAPRQMVTLKGTVMAGKNNQGVLQALLEQSSAQERGLKKEQDNKFMSVLEEEDQEQ